MPHSDCRVEATGNKVSYLLSEVVTMTAIAIPRSGVKWDLPVRRLLDYHTVGGGYDPKEPGERGCITVSAGNGKPRQKGGRSLPVLTYRQYLADASFGVLLEGASPLLKQIADALEDPIWGIWLGRKTCIPSTPVFAGLKNNRDNALRLLIGEKPLESFTPTGRSGNLFRWVRLSPGCTGIICYGAQIVFTKESANIIKE